MASEGESAAVAQPSRRRAAAWSLGLAYVGQGIAIAKGIVFVPLYLRYFSLDTYGAWLASANVVAILGLMELGLSMVFYQQLGHAFGAGERRRFASLVGAGAVCMLALIVLFGGVAAALAPIIPGLVNAPPGAQRPLMTTFLLVAVSAAMNLALSNAIAITHAWQRTEIGGAARVLGQLAEVVVLFGALTKGLGLVSLGVGALVGSLVSCGVVVSAIAVIWPRVGLPRPTLDRLTLREVLATGAPVAASRISSTVASNIEIALVAALMNPALAAVYGITERIFKLALGFVNPIAGSVLSPLAHLVGAHGLPATRKVIYELSAVWAGVVAVTFPTLLYINRDFVTLWVGAENYGGLPLSLAICVSTIISSRLFLSVIALTSLGEIARTSWSTLVEPLFRLPLMLLGLTLVGPIGLPLASSVGGAILAFWLFPRFLARKVGEQGHPGSSGQFAGHAAVLGCVGLAVLASTLLPRSSSWYQLAAAGAIAAVAASLAALCLSPAIRRESGRHLRRLRRAVG